MTRFHKIVIDGEKHYRELNEATGYYENQILSEDEVIELLLEEAVEDVIEVDKAQVERAISCVPQSYQRELIQNYIDYLEHLIESFE